MKTLDICFFDGSAASVARLRAALRESAAVHLRGAPAGDAVLPFYTDLLAQLGDPELRGEDIDGQRFPAGQWLDIRYDPARAGSFRHSNTRQPLHTDGSYIDSFDYDVVVLVCEQAARHGGATHFIDADTLTALLALEDPQLLAELKTRAVIFSKDGMGTLNRRVVERDGQGWLLNWNAFRVAAANPRPVRHMAERLHRFLEQRVVDAGLVQAVGLAPGEALFFHDRRVLHGRFAFFGARCLYKGTLRL
jgi:alpha-ketoglutarate-dependent taurine dioxygenase